MSWKDLWKNLNKQKKSEQQKILENAGVTNIKKKWRILRTVTKTKVKKRTKLRWKLISQ